MNVFFLDYHPDLCAQYHTDKHVVKMILESAQLLSAAYPDGAPVYKKTHVNHPMSIYCRAKAGNFRRILDYMAALCREYSYRYGKVHKSEKMLEYFLNNVPNLPQGECEPPRCFGDFKGKIQETSCVVADYRRYYQTKERLFSWKDREKPYWL